MVFRMNRRKVQAVLFISSEIYVAVVLDTWLFLGNSKTSRGVEYLKSTRLRTIMKL